jgi:lysophospholipase L1-like esterase
VSLRSLLKKAALSSAAIIATLLVLEALVRIFAPQDLRLNFSQWDPYVGFVNIPGMEGVTIHRDYQMRVAINSLGLRDRDIPYEKTKDTYRIGVFGDSFTFGEGVQNSETYPKLLENLLKADGRLNATGTRIEVINFGIGKTGTSHQYAFYQKEGKKYHLDLVILGFLASNDFGDNLAGVFTLQNEQLAHNPAAYSSVRRLQKIVYYLPFYKWLTGHSHLSNLIRIKATHLDDYWRTRKNAETNVAANTGADTDRLKVELTDKLVSAFASEVKQAGGKLLLINLPAKTQRPLLSYAANETPPEYVVLYHRLEKEMDRRRELDRLDLCPIFANFPIEPYYFPNDGHMTALGHQLAAEAIRDYLKPRLIDALKARPSS